MTEQQAKLLEAPFEANEIDWRVIITKRDKTQGQVAAYVDSRAIQRRLDSVLGRNNWQNKFNPVPGDSKATTSYVCEISIYYADRKEWITKSDGAGGTDIEPVKGGLSNAFKRAASMWGIGRYLYELTGAWVKLKDGKYIDDTEKPRLNALYNEFIGKEKSENQQSPGSTQAQKSTPATSSQPTQRKQFTKQSTLTEVQKSPKDDKTVSKKYQITDLTVSRGGKGTQTVVTMQTPEGDSMKGYIKGTAPLHSGQYIDNLKIITKTDPRVGNYNIIEGYKVAA